MTEENRNTTEEAPVTPQTPATPEWRTVTPQFQSEIDLANGFRSTKAALTQAQQELAALKSQKPESTPAEQPAAWDWNDPNKMFNANEGKFNPEFKQHLVTKLGAPDAVVDEWFSTITEARNIITQARSQKFDNAAGFQNSEQMVVNYLTQTYQGQELNDRLTDLQHPRYWEKALTDTLTEMKDKNWQPGRNEPSPLPREATNSFPAGVGVGPLDPNSVEARSLMSKPEYRTDPKLQATVSERIRVWKLMTSR